MFDLTGYLERGRRVVEAGLDAVLPGEDTPPQVLHKAMRYSVMSAGKRLRPILCMAAAEAVGAAAEAALKPALAVELLHTYTLIHDDLPCMDDDDLRRGRPTSHRVFGEANAVLAGDAIQSLAFEVLGGTSSPPGYPAGRLVAELASAAGSRGVVGGQVEDLAACERRPTEEVVEWIHRRKTADLFRAAVRIGAMAGGAGDADLERLTEYAVRLGLAFQLADDVSDASASRPGDRVDGASMVDLLGPEATLRRAREHVGEAEASLAGFASPRAEPLKAIVRHILV